VRERESLRFWLLINGSHKLNLRKDAGGGKILGIVTFGNSFQLFGFPHLQAAEKPRWMAIPGLPHRMPPTRERAQKLL
jgi:hypothetical protein